MIQKQTRIGLELREPAVPENCALAHGDMARDMALHPDHEFNILNSEFEEEP